MKSIFTGNMSVLEARSPSLGSAVLSAECGSIEVMKSKQGGPVPAKNIQGRRVQVHSRFDPEREAERFSGTVTAGDFDLIIVFGFGFAYHLEFLVADVMPDALLLVIEHDAGMVRSALENRDLTRLLGDDRVMLLVDPEEDDISEAIRGRSSRRVTFLTHRGSFQSEPDYYGNILEITRSLVSTRDVNIATLARFEKVWSANMARNIRHITGMPGAGGFYGRFKGVPAIIAAAGPSLSKSINFIRENRHRAIIIAVDTSYRILMENGIEPHFCICVDPQVINARYFEGTPASGTVLIADPTVHPSVFRLFRGRAAVTGVAFEMFRWVEQLAGEKGEMCHGGSVSTNAYDFALRTGASPLIMVGQDLAFTGGLAHARGSYLDEQVHLRTGRLSTPEMSNRRQLFALPRIMVRGIRSESVHTNQKMMIFLSWFEKRGVEFLVNATEDGALIPGVHHQSAKDLELEDIDLDLELEIRNIYENASQGLDPLRVNGLFSARLSRMLDEIEDLLPLLEKAVGYSEDLGEVINSPARDQGKLDYLLKKMSEADRKIQSKKNIKEMISITIQRVLHTITGGYDMDENDSELETAELTAKRSLYLYRGLLEGALFNKKILGKMKSIMEQNQQMGLYE